MPSQTKHIVLASLWLFMMGAGKQVIFVWECGCAYKIQIKNNIFFLRMEKSDRPPYTIHTTRNEMRFIASQYDYYYCSRREKKCIIKNIIERYTVRVNRGKKYGYMKSNKVFWWGFW